MVRRRGAEDGWWGWGREVQYLLIYLTNEHLHNFYEHLHNCNTACLKLIDSK